VHAQPRRALQLGAAALVGALLIVWGPGSASPASALAVAPNVPAPIGLPGSAYSSASSAMTAAQWNAFLQAHPELAVGTGTAGSAAAKIGTSAAGGAATAVSGFLVGTQLGTGLAQTFGLPTSGNFFCDLGTLAGTSGCAGVQGAPSYVPNSDVTPMPAGWANNTNATGTMTSAYAGTYWGGGWTSGHATVTNPTAPAYGATSGSAGATITMSGTCVGTGGVGTAQNPSIGASAVFLAGTLSVSKTIGFGTGQLQTSCAVPSVTGSNANVTSGDSRYTFDHLEFTFQGQDSGSPSYTLKWYPVGYPNRPTGVSADPQRTLRNTWTCTQGAGGVASTAAFSETASAWPTVPAAQCAQGMVASVKVEEVTNGTGTVIYQWTLPAEVGTVATNYPECANAASPCQLLLSRISAPGATTLVSCFTNPAVCTSWWTETSQGTATGSNTATKSGTEYECSYGTHAVALTECAAYAHAFPAAETGTGVLSNPTTGEAPSSQPSTSPQDQSCPPPFSWSALFNNWWAYKATACALKDAFVPSTASSTAWKSFVGDASARPPVNVAVGGVQFTNAVISGLSASGDCTNLPLQMAGGPMGSSASFDLCAGVQQAGQTTWGQLLRHALEVVIIGGGCWIAYHRVAASFGGKS